MESEIVSIIVPIYNSEETLERMMDSLLAQTYGNTEIILVNDGSIDKTSEILEKYRNEKNVKIINRENGGVSAARNTGLMNASGEYIAFVDSDDYVEKDYIEYMYNVLKENGADIVSCGVTNIMLNGKTIPDSYPGIIVMDKKEALERMLYNNRFYVTLWDKLYKKELFDKIKFDEGKLFEDTGTTYRVVMNAEKIIYAGKPLYFYKNSADSITTSDFKESKLDYIEMAKKMAGDIEKAYPELEKGCRRKVLHALFSTLMQLAKSDKREKETEKKIFAEIKKLRCGVFFDKKAPKRDKAAIISSLFGFGVFKFSWRIYGILRK